MKKLGVLFVCCGILFAVSGCALQRSPVANIADLTKVDFSTVDSLKESKACATYVFGFIGPFGDPTVMKAMKSGGLKTVKLVDYKSSFYLLFSNDCVIVYGE